MTTAACISSVRSALVLGGLAALALVSTSCSTRVRVTTAAAPGANLVGLHTFRVLDGPERGSGIPGPLTADPLFANSIMDERVRADLVEGFERRGYVQSLTDPDFLVAYSVMEAPEDARGLVIIDVLHSRTMKPLWRGEGVINMWIGSITYGLELDESVAAVLLKFPRRS